MLDFNLFKTAVAGQFELMKRYPLFKVEVSKDEMWDTYLGAFPDGTNPMFRERTVHDCQCCKQFISRVGNVVAYIGEERISIWDGLVDDAAFGIVSEAMATLIHRAEIRHPFYHYEKAVGTNQNHGLSPDNVAETWEHFYIKLPENVIMPKDQIATKIGKQWTARNTLDRALHEIDISATETVIELIDQKSLYRGDQHERMLAKFLFLQRTFNELEEEEHDTWLWQMSLRNPAVSAIRNSSIGTLLVDLTEGRTLDAAVKSYEEKVAPANYQRPKALITKKMIDKARNDVEELGYTSALGRRHAVMTDITIPNVLFADRSAKAIMDGDDPFAQLVTQAPIDSKKLDKVEEVDITTFINDVLPSLSSIEVLMEHSHQNNLMTLVAPKDPESKNMLQWGNNFTWSYAGEVADSMKENVRKAGGKVDGALRFSIQWNDTGKTDHSDLDAHCHEPGGHIYFSRNLLPVTGGNLDVDIVDPKPGQPAVENITWPQMNRMKPGQYKFQVHCYASRQGNAGFTAELEYQGEIRHYTYNKPLVNKAFVDVCTLQFQPYSPWKIIEEMKSTIGSQQVWGKDTNQFHKVSLIMNSPNHWDGEETGNKHYFFILEDCKTPEPPRGFYNEFLDSSLREHRKVFEVLGSKMKVAESDDQLSGLGFSATQRNHVFARVTGNFTRTIKITF